MQAGAEDERDAGDHQQDDEQRHQHHRHRVGQPEIIFRIKIFFSGATSALLTSLHHLQSFDPPAMKTFQCTADKKYLRVEC